jgi:hypothetical protein
VAQFVTIGPFSAYFTNVNRQMELPGHSHFAQITFCYRHQGHQGFPAFETTYRAVQLRIRELFSKPLRNMTNEAVARYVFEQFQHWSSEAITEWNSEPLDLYRVDLDVRGVPDHIGHADGFTRYTVQQGES